MCCAAIQQLCTEEKTGKNSASGMANVEETIMKYREETVSCRDSTIEARQAAVSIHKSIWTSVGTKDRRRRTGPAGTRYNQSVFNLPLFGCGNKSGKVTVMSHVGGMCKAFVCEICDKAFRFRSNLAEHRSVHSAMKPYVCKICGKAARLKGNLTKHILKDHNAQLTEYLGTQEIAFTQKGKKSVKDPMTREFLSETIAVVEPIVHNSSTSIATDISSVYSFESDSFTHSVSFPFLDMACRGQNQEQSGDCSNGNSDRSNLLDVLESSSTPGCDDKKLIVDQFSQMKMGHAGEFFTPVEKIISGLLTRVNHMEEYSGRIQSLSSTLLMLQMDMSNEMTNFDDIIGKIDALDGRRRRIVNAAEVCSIPSPVWIVVFQDLCVTNQRNNALERHVVSCFGTYIYAIIDLIGEPPNIPTVYPFGAGFGSVGYPLPYPGLGHGPGFGPCMDRTNECMFFQMYCGLPRITEACAGSCGLCNGINRFGPMSISPYFPMG
ncbi:zinc finger protein 1 like protein [Ditylenchus destructor]|nr:zinc finger protein 1 like protein [Ditylenchus destructor]